MKEKRTPILLRAEDKTLSDNSRKPYPTRQAGQASCGDEEATKWPGAVPFPSRSNTPVGSTVCEK